MAARALRTAMALAGMLLPACVVKLSDVNAPLDNGGVTGEAADCSRTQVPPQGGPGSGAAEPRFIGRFDTSAPPNAVFDWSGSEITTRFSGSSLTVGLVADKPLVFTAVIDDGAPFKFQVGAVDPSTGKRQTSYALPVTGAGNHEVTIHRDSEALLGPTTFTGFSLSSGGQFLPPTERPRRIELIGDSITCGYGDEGANATCPFDVPVDPNQPNGDRIPKSENHFLSYGAIAARQLSAEAVTICYSGKGVYQNYREQGAGMGPTGAVTTADPDARTTMPQYWERTLGSQKDGPAWDFANEPEPQVVVIAIGTNDFMRDNNQDSIADGIDLKVFQAAYADFVTKVRQRRPNAHIFLTVSPMVTDKFPLDNARTDFRTVLHNIASVLNARGDAKVYAMEFVEMGSRYGLGCDYHPNLEVHRIMADQLVGAIRSKTCW
jgi:lysophospholipase L1-like esterase